MGIAARQKFYIRNLDTFTTHDLSKEIIIAKRVNGHYQTGQGKYIRAEIFKREFMPFEWYINKNIKIKKGE